MGQRSLLESDQIYQRRDQRRSLLRQRHLESSADKAGTSGWVYVYVSVVVVETIRTAIDKSSAVSPRPAGRLIRVGLHVSPGNDFDLTL